MKLSFSRICIITDFIPVLLLFFQIFKHGFALTIIKQSLHENGPSSQPRQLHSGTNIDNLKCNFPTTPLVRLLVGRSVGLP